MKRALSALGLLLASAAAVGQTALELDPTQFQAPSAVESPAEYAGFKASVGIESFDRRRPVPDAPDTALRSVLDFRKEWRVGDQLRLTLSNRLEWLAVNTGQSSVRNALREAYLSVGVGDSAFVDVGRINVRSGVGLGFNPSDWLREGVSLPQTTQNPASQRENRLGTGMLKVQTVQDWGAAHVALIPHLARRPDEESPYGLDFGRTNEDPALHVRVAPKVNERISVDMLAYARRGRQPQWGLNTTAVLSDALIAHLEWSAGVREGLGAPSQQRSRSLHHRVATGLSWTAPNGAVLAMERHLATDALSRDDWDTWRESTANATAARLGQLRNERSALQDPLVRDAWFFRVAMNGLMRDPDIDVSGFLRLNPHDHSRLWQLDGSWHANAQLSLHASVGGFSGGSRSEFGANALQSFVALRAEVAF